MKKSNNEMNNIAKDESLTEKSNHLINEANRTNKKRKYHGREGMRQVFRNPIKMLCILFFAAFFIAANCVLQRFFSYCFVDSEWLLLVPYMSYATTISLFGAILVRGLLPWLGKPKLEYGMKADEIESDLAYILNLPERLFYMRPFIITSKPIQGSTANALDYIFFSKHHSLEEWQNPAIRERLRTKLDCKSIEDFRYGTKWAFNKWRFRKCEDYRIVILSVVPNDGTQGREAANDPLFRD